MAANAASIPRTGEPSRDQSVAGQRRAGFATFGYGAAALAVMLGWIVTRRYQLVDPLNGAGYWLGIVGASLMALLLLYPVRKRVRMLRYLGSTRCWFQMHMCFGVLGPLLILYHCNFSPGSLNSNIALFCTLLVAVSGLIGRYLYSRIFADLEGHRKSLEQLSLRARLTNEQKIRAARLAPHLVESMDRFDRMVLTPPESFRAAMLLLPWLAISTRLGGFRLAASARREIRREAKKAGISKPQRKKVERAVTEMISTHLRRVRRVAEFHSYERLFSLWHVFHLPFFYILVVTALVHVLAVHMY